MYRQRLRRSGGGVPPPPTVPPPPAVWSNHAVTNPSQFQIIMSTTTRQRVVALDLEGSGSTAGAFQYNNE